MKFQINKGKYGEMREYMDENIDWINLLRDEDNVDECWNKIENVINEAKNKLILKVRPNSRNKIENVINEAKINSS